MKPIIDKKEDLKQSLSEHIGEWLENEQTQENMTLSGLKDSDDLHLLMASAAWDKFYAVTRINSRQAELIK